MSQIISDHTTSNMSSIRHKATTSGLFVRARLPSDCLHIALRGENTWGAPFPLRINLQPRKRGGDCLCSRPPWFGSDVFTIRAHCLPSRNERCQFSSAPESTLEGEDNLCLCFPFFRRTHSIAAQQHIHGEIASLKGT